MDGGCPAGSGTRTPTLAWAGRCPPDCYDYDATVVWNAHAPELWRRTTIGIRWRLDRLARDQDRAANTVSVNVVLKDATAYAVRDPPHSVGRQRLFYG
jgi:hypothetical protein